jgi:uncharacterized membrane protein YkoI
MRRLFVPLTWKTLLAIVFTTTALATQESSKEEKLKISQLPAAVAQASSSNCPGCRIDKATREVENGVTVYDIEFKDGKGEIALAEDGSVIDRETAVLLKDVPPAALEAIRNGAAGSKIKYVAKGEIHAELKDGQIIKLSSPRYVYEAELQKDNQAAEIEVTSDGQVTEAPKWKRKGTKQN